MNIGANIRKLTLVFVALFLAISGGLVYWQVGVAQQVTANIHNSRTCMPGNAPIRGNIYDRNGVLLAYSVPSSTGCGYIRHYTDPSLAGLIGYYVSPQFSSTGVEHQFDNVLSGQSGPNTMNNLVNRTLHRPPVGGNVYLTIDERIQKIVNQHFDDPIPIDNVNTFPTDRGSVIVADPHTGEILAMLSRPTFDPNKLVQTLASGNLGYYNQLVTDPEQPLLERPINGLFIPGSIYKTATLEAGLDSGSTTLNQEFTQQQAEGPVNVNGEVIGPVGNNIDTFTFHFPVTTEYGFSHSDNLIYAQVAAETGAQTWLDYQHRFYVGQSIPFDLPVTPSQVTRAGQSTLNGIDLANDGFGQGVDQMTPLQMSLFDNAAANNGQLMRPRVVLKETDANKKVTQTFTPQVLGQPISQQTATEVRQAMYGVTQCGSLLIVPQVHNSPWGIIGKTGTGQVSDNGQPPANGWTISQAPYAITNPDQLPALTIVAMKENGGEGGNVDGPMSASIYQDIFANGYVQAQMPPAPDPNYCFNTGLLQ